MGGKVTQTIKEKLGIIQTCTYLTITAKGDDSYGNVTQCRNVHNIVEIWAENFQCFALDISGNLYSWGLNDYCQLGNGHADNYIFPKEDPIYSFVNNLSIINLSKGLISEKIFREQNPLYMKYIKKVSCGDGFTILLDREGVVYSFGKNNKGQLGYELSFENSTIVSATKCQANPKVVTSLQERNFKIVDIACGSDFVFATEENGQNFSWGNNDHNQLARHTDRSIEPIPEVAEHLSGLDKFTKILCGWMHGCILTETGDIFVWGNPFHDYIKNNPDIKHPFKIEIPFKAVDLACGFHHFCAILFEDFGYELYTFGANEYGQCGLQVKKERVIIHQPTKITFPNEMKIMQVYCGAFHTICTVTGNKLYSFGHNFNKECGDYSSKFIDRPVEWGWNIKESKSGEEYKIKNILCGNGFSIIVQVPLDSHIFYDNVDHKNEQEYTVVKVKEMIEMKDKENDNL